MNVVIKISLEELSWFLWISITNWFSLNFCSQHLIWLFQIQHMYRCARVQGLDTSEGLLLFGKEHFYVIDGYTMTVSREIRDIDTLPPKYVQVSFHAVKTLMCYFTCLIQGYRFWSYIFPWVKDDIILLETAVGACAAWDDVMLLLQHARRLWRDMTNFPQS